MTSRYELDVLRIEELGDGPFTFTVWVGDILQEPRDNDRIPLPRTGLLTIHICTDEFTVGKVNVPLHLINCNTCCWLPLSNVEAVTELDGKVEGPRAMVSFTRVDLLSPVSEHCSFSERSFTEMKLESPKALKRKVLELRSEEEGLRKILQDVLDSVKTHSEQKADLKRIILRQDRDLQATRLQLVQKRTKLDDTLGISANSRHVENEKLHLLARSYEADLKELTLRNEAVVAEMEAELQNSRGAKQTTAARIQELETKLKESLDRERKGAAALDALQQEATGLRNTCDACNVENAELKATLWRLKASQDKTQQDDERISALHDRLEESERHRARLLEELHTMKDFIQELNCKDTSSQTESLKLQLALMSEEVKHLSEDLQDAQEEAIRLQSYEDYAPLAELSYKIDELNQKACQENEATEKLLQTQIRSSMRLREQSGMLTADLQSTQLLLKSKQSQLQECQAENTNLMAQLTVYAETTQQSSEDGKLLLKDNIHSDGLAYLCSRLGDKDYKLRGKRLTIWLHNGQLLVKTRDGGVPLEDYIKANRSDFTKLKELASTTSKSFSSNRSSSTGLISRNIESLNSSLLDAKDIDSLADTENLMLQSFTVDESSYRRCAVVQQSPRVDITKPTKCSLLKRADRTPLATHNLGGKTPRKPALKRLPFKM